MAIDRMQEPYEGYSIAQQIIADIHSKTGLSFLHISGIDTDRPEVAAAVLPVLKEWVPFIEHVNLRQAVYMRFLTRHAQPFMGSLLEWVKREDDRVALSMLVQAIALCAKPSDAERMWQVFHEIRCPDSYYAVMARLATFPSTAAAAKEEVVRALENSAPSVSDLQDIVRIDDPRIRRWFEAQTNAAHPVIRTLARRVANRGRSLPRGMEVVTTPPDHGRELFSTEVDLENVPALLRELGEQYGFRIPPGIRSGGFLSRLEVDQWARIGVRTKAAESVILWFRLEDIDTVEILVAPGQSQVG
jgi:hypothetical protein